MTITEKSGSKKSGIFTMWIWLGKKHILLFLMSVLLSKSHQQISKALNLSDWSSLQIHPENRKTKRGREKRTQREASLLLRVCIPLWSLIQRFWRCLCVSTITFSTHFFFYLLCSHSPMPFLSNAWSLWATALVLKDLSLLLQNSWTQILKI